jgi:site-specific DNA-cytosine methylase
MGNEDDRALWPEMFRVIKEVRPDWVCGENVTGIISMALDGVLSDLESAGYTCQPIVLPACAVNAPHRRDRVFIVAHTGQHNGHFRQRAGSVRGSQQDQGRQAKAYRKVGQSERGGNQSRLSKAMADTNAGKTTDENEETWLIRQAAGKVSTPPLTLAVKMWPTPNTGIGNQARARQEAGTNSPQLPEVIGGQLNPMWVEWLMGFPAGWTDLEL